MPRGPVTLPIFIFGRLIHHHIPELCPRTRFSARVGTNDAETEPDRTIPHRLYFSLSMPPPRPTDLDFGIGSIPTLFLSAAPLSISEGRFPVFL
ncbi:hypothetical protein C0995_004171 [Termitomyces sp. Mi166|nr:hypothetical protein C0995_004171 [Termitomyces sp. Mi166\